MPTNTDFQLAKSEDGTLTVYMAPPTAVGGWTVEFRVQKYFGDSSGLIRKYLASGLNGASGITVTNSGQGTFAIDLQSINTSGMSFGNYAYTVERTDSSQRTILSLGYMILTPNTG
jgi:hypothetical protein